MEYLVLPYKQSDNGITLVRDETLHIVIFIKKKQFDISIILVEYRKKFNYCKIL